jgi:hypothetical protein
MTGIEGLEFQVEVRDAAENHVEDFAAAANNLLVARAAYEVALKLKPGPDLILRHRVRVISRARG